VEEIKDASLPERMARLEQKVESGFQNIQVSQQSQQIALGRIEQKLDDNSGRTNARAR